MNVKLSKLVAREVLIIISILVLDTTLLLIGDHFTTVYSTKVIQHKPPKDLFAGMGILPKPVEILFEAKKRGIVEIPIPENKIDWQRFAILIKEKFPNCKSIDDYTLSEIIVKKYYSTYKDKVNLSEPARRDILVVGKNVKKMISLNAPESDIDTYVKSEGYNPNTFTEQHNAIKYKKVLFLKSFFGIIQNIGLFLLLGIYPIYLVVRLIVWSIKTLRQKEMTK